MLSLIKQYDLMSVQSDDKSDALAERYVNEGIISAKKRGDAIHIALTTINNLDSVG
jgi:hypothetical protein